MINLKNISTILFDLGGVILNIDSQLTDQAFASLGTGSSMLSHVQNVRKDPVFTKYERGELSSAEFREQACSLLGITAEEATFDRAWNALLLDIPLPRIQLLRDLRNDFRVILFSNTNEIHHQAIDSYVQRERGLRDLSSLFEHAHYSYIEGVRKPDVPAFLQILAKSRLDPASTLFIDDSAENIEGARRAGLQVFHHSPKQEIVTLLTAALR